MAFSSADILITTVVAVVVLLDIVYIFRSRKKGKCIGCPYAASCGKTAGNCPGGGERE